MNTCLLNPRPADPRYTNIVNGATSLVGIPSIPIVATDTDNACATKTHQGIKVIAYNETFLCDIESMNYTAMEAVLIHEVGHHHQSSDQSCRRVDGCP